MAGANRATPIRNLETETATPTLDLYLNKRLADFEARTEKTGKTELVQQTWAVVATPTQEPRETEPNWTQASAKQRQYRGHAKGSTGQKRLAGQVGLGVVGGSKQHRGCSDP